ncbi:hypothetical protein HNP84_001701 [Thermocatellispora tengchongensis]|uniref:Uncharacterized protein n=1 Tax=Thermocatellispora tengchongensis TaxID=1073253 RepID=A0A840NWU4_9ACTN|nr:hypothetical protein [Thermocatellispora tengchongensis]MBB5131988.1 hypothetical protein [Thermocatellispora tengchongensis]
MSEGQEPADVVGLIPRIRAALPRKKPGVVVSVAVVAVIGTAVVAYTATRGTPTIEIRGPSTAAGSLAGPCPLVEGVTTLPEDVDVIVGVRPLRGNGSVRFYRTSRLGGDRWRGEVSLDGHDAKAPGDRWYSVTAFAMPKAWTDFWVQKEGSADTLTLMVAPTLPPTDEEDSIEVQRGTGQGPC